MSLSAIWSFADQVSEGGAKGAAGGAAVIAFGDPALLVDQHDDRLIGHLPASPCLPGGVIGQRIGDGEAAGVGTTGGHRVVVGDPDEANAAGELLGDLGQLGLFGLADRAPGLEEAHERGASPEVVQGDGAAVEGRYLQGRSRLAAGRSDDARWWRVLSWVRASGGRRGDDGGGRGRGRRLSGGV